MKKRVLQGAVGLLGLALVMALVAPAVQRAAQAQTPLGPVMELASSARTGMAPFTIERTATGIQDTSTAIGDWIECNGGMGVIELEIRNAAGGSTLTGFAMDARAHKSGNAQPIFEDTDWTNLAGSGDLIFVANDPPNTYAPHALVASDTKWAYIRVRTGGAQAVRFRATGAAAPGAACTVSLLGRATKY